MYTENVFKVNILLVNSLVAMQKNKGNHNWTIYVLDSICETGAHPHFVIYIFSHISGTFVWKSSARLSYVTNIVTATIWWCNETWSTAMALTRFP